MADYNSSYTGAEIDAAIGEALGAPTTYAPIAHDNAATTYGKGSSSKYGHVKLSDSTSSTSDTTGGVAATPKAVKAAYDLANGKQSALTFDLSPTQNSSNPVTSGGIYTALQNAVSNFTKIESGSYVGTGTSGSSNPNSITFSFSPKLVIINSQDITGSYLLTMIVTSGSAKALTMYPSTTATITWTGNKLQYYTSGATEQLNKSGATYDYVAFG